MNNEYKTKDIYVSAVLLVLGYRLSDITTSGKIAFFHFENPEENIEYVVQNYWTNQIDVPAMSLFTAFKELKHMMYDRFKSKRV
jgi:hypothetical protein